MEHNIITLFQYSLGVLITLIAGQSLHVSYYYEMKKYAYNACISSELVYLSLFLSANNWTTLKTSRSMRQSCKSTHAYCKVLLFTCYLRCYVTIVTALYGFIASNLSNDSCLQDINDLFLKGLHIGPRYYSKFNLFIYPQKYCFPALFGGQLFRKKVRLLFKFNE